MSRSSGNFQCVCPNGKVAKCFYDFATANGWRLKWLYGSGEYDLYRYFIVYPLEKTIVPIQEWFWQYPHLGLDEAFQSVSPQTSTLLPFTINGYKVEAFEGKAKIGCVEVSVEQIREILKAVESFT